ncbi:MAG: efflux transporter outer membrane subunit [Methylophilaceae bacterium]
MKKPMMKNLSLILVVFLTACQIVGPNYQRNESALPATYGELKASSDASTGAAEVNMKEWWTHYQDPKLNELVDLALRNNTSVALAMARIEEADANMREIGASLYPQVNVSAGVSRSKVTEFGSFPTFGGAERNHFQFGLNTAYEIDFWGRIKRAKEAASAGALGARFGKDTVELSLLGLVSSNYLQLRGLDAQIAVTQDNQKSRNESLALTKRRLAGGVASALEVSQAEVAVSNLEAQQIELTRLRALTLHQLQVLTGVLDLQLEAGDIRQLPMPPVPPAGLPSALLENRPDIRQAEQTLIAENANIGIAKAAMYPSISLTGSLGMESALLKNLLKSGASIWSLGLGLDLPIFDSGKRQSRVDQSSAKQKQALAQYQAAIQNAFKEVNDALINRRLNAERELALSNSTVSAKNALNVAENRYKSGYSAYLDVLDAQRVYNDASSAAVQAKQATFLATVELFKALGGDWRGAVNNEAKPDAITTP